MDCAVEWGLGEKENDDNKRNNVNYKTATKLEMVKRSDVGRFRVVTTASPEEGGSGYFELATTAS